MAHEMKNQLSADSLDVTAVRPGGPFYGASESSPARVVDAMSELLSAALYMMEHQQAAKVEVFGKRILRSELKNWIRAVLIR